MGISPASYFNHIIWKKCDVTRFHSYNTILYIQINIRRARLSPWIWRIYKDWKKWWWNLSEYKRNVNGMCYVEVLFIYFKVSL